MPYKIAGQPGTWYEPGTRKGNATIAWRGQLPSGQWTEIVTPAGHQSAAQAHVRRFLEDWHRHRPPTAGAAVDLDTAAHHYKATLRSDDARDKVDQVVRLVGPRTPIAAINQSHLTAAAKEFIAERAAANAEALRAAPPRQTYPPPSAETINRNITTPLRAVVRFAAAQEWRSLIELKAIKPLEGETPRQRPPAADDADVAQLLAAIENAIGQCRPTAKGRDKASTQKATGLRALYALVLLVHERGYRISEWLRWNWSTVTLGQAKASILLSKPDRWAEFELSPEAVAALSAMPARDQGKVFPWIFRSAVYGAVDAVAPPSANGGRVHWRPHASRRAVVTAVIRETGDPAAARDYVGHANIKTTLRYSRPDVTSPQVRAGGRRGTNGSSR